MCLYVCLCPSVCGGGGMTVSVCLCACNHACLDLCHCAHAEVRKELCEIIFAFPIYLGSRHQ